MVIEHNAQVGRKIIISGGGRCNFTNIHTKPENFISGNPHFCKSALARYTPRDFVELVKKHRIEYYEKKLGQLFCRERSRLIVEMLLTECEKAKVVVQTDCSVKDLRKERLFELETNRGKFSCESLVIATGGLSFPKIGATDFGYKVAKQFSVKRTDLRPSLVALVFSGGKPIRSSRAFPLIRSFRPANIHFARISCLLIAAFPARRSCKYRITGKNWAPFS